MNTNKLSVHIHSTVSDGIISIEVYYNFEELILKMVCLSPYRLEFSEHVCVLVRDPSAGFGIEWPWAV